MAQARYYMTVTEEGQRCPPRQVVCAPGDRLQVRDQSTRLVTTVPANEISLYRHVLFLEGKAYRILNVAQR